MKKLQLTIPEACHENWSLMTPAEKGKFCSACQKNVFDFTKATDRDIINAYENDQKLCGRFLKTQLDRELIIPKEKKSIWLASVFFGMMSLTNTKIVAQEKPNTEQTETKYFIEKPAQQRELPTDEEKIITGVVSDDIGPLPGVNVVVKGTTKGVSTNFDGTFSIKVKKGDVLIFSFIGMKEKKVKIKKFKAKYNIKVKMDSQVLGGIAVIETNTSKSFFSIIKKLSV